VIAVDTSALMAIVLDEPAADACMGVLEGESQALISAGTVAEALIVAARRGAAAKMAQLIGGLGLSVVAVTEASARRMAEAYERWGKGVHPAGLNLGDCFAYDVAKEHGCPLLFIGKGFSRTDLQSALFTSPP
jgi:ribonuclease VapC